MAKPKYVELVFKDGPRHPLTQYEIVSDHRAEDGSTHLFLKLREAQPQPKAAAPVKRRKRKSALPADIPTAPVVAAD